MMDLNAKMNQSSLYNSGGAGKIGPMKQRSNLPFRYNENAQTSEEKNVDSDVESLSNGNVPVKVKINDSAKENEDIVKIMERSDEYTTRSTNTINNAVMATPPQNRKNNGEDEGRTSQRRKSRAGSASGFASGPSPARRRQSSGVELLDQYHISPQEGEVSDSEGGDEFEEGSESDLGDEDIQVNDLYAEQHNDEGDSDVEYYQDESAASVIKKLLASSESHENEKSIPYPVEVFSVPVKEEIASKTLLIRPSLSLPESGVGLKGHEGAAVSKLFGSVDELVQLGKDISSHDASENKKSVKLKADKIQEEFTFGRGASQTHPWTSRADGGINSRLLSGKRGQYIYFVGVIDILQQYNTSKRLETIYKVKMHI